MAESSSERAAGEWRIASIVVVSACTCSKGTWMGGLSFSAPAEEGVTAGAVEGSVTGACEGAAVLSG